MQAIAKKIAPFRWTSSQLEVVKWLAIGFMVLDHINHLWLDKVSFSLMALGRISYPLFAIVLAYHLVFHTQRHWKYAFRLLLLGIVSQIPYMWAFDLQYDLNILFTLSLGIALVKIWEWVWLPDTENVIEKAFRAILITLLILIVSLFVDYGPMGVILILTLFAWFKTETPIWFLLSVIVLWGINYFVPIGLFALISLPLAYSISHLNTSMSRSSKWIYYSIYPAHIVLIKAASFWIT